MASTDGSHNAGEQNIRGDNAIEWELWVYAHRSLRVKVDRLDNIDRSTGVSNSPADTIAREVRQIVAEEFRKMTGRRLPLYELVVATIEKPLIEAVLDHERGNQSHAALTLGINRNTLLKKMRVHGITTGGR